MKRAGGGMVATKVHKIDLSADEFLAAVSGEMSMAELGLYFMINLLQYSRGERIKKDLPWLRSKFRAGTDQQHLERCLNRLVSSGRVKGDGEELWVSRAEAELERARSRMRAARKHGRSGGRAKGERKVSAPGAKGERGTENEQNQRDKKPEALSASNPDEKLSPSPSPSPVSKEERSSNDGGPAPPLPASQPPPNVIQTPKAVLFGQCREYLIRSGMTDKAARNLLGKWAKASGDMQVVDVVSEAMAKDVQEPKSWITAALTARSAPAKTCRVMGV